MIYLVAVFQPFLCVERLIEFEPFDIARARTRLNWCVEWWLEDMYLKQPAALPINSSPGMMIHKNNSRHQSLYTYIVYCLDPLTSHISP